MLAVEAKGLYSGYGGRPILKDLSLSIPHPSLSVVMGPNGAGKTTLLRTLLGMVPIISGELRVLGEPIPERIGDVRRRVAYVPQKEEIGWEVPISVLDVVVMLRVIKKGPPRKPTLEDVEVARRALGLVDMEWAEKRCFRALSGGQQQRVLIARAIASEPELLLLDEPVSAIDAESRHKIAEVLVKLRDEAGITSLIVTHDVNPFAHVADYVAILNNGELVAAGPVATALTPENLVAVYGPRAKIVEVGGVCYAIVSDAHR